MIRSLPWLIVVGYWVLFFEGLLLEWLRPTLAGGVVAIFDAVLGLALTWAMVRRWREGE